MFTADPAVSFAIEKLGDALINKVKFLKGVKGKVGWVKDELESMQGFLKDAAEKQGQDESVRKWISDVREVAHDAEDAIDIFTLKLDTEAPIIRKRDLARKWAGFPSHVSQLNRVGKEIESIRTRLDEIAKRRDVYGIQKLGEESSSSRSRSEMVQLRRRSQMDKDVVGLKQDTNLLLREVILNEKKQGLSLALIVGMGGIGKSTLARKIYNHPDITARFEKRAWVVVPSEFAAEDIMKQIMQHLSLPLSAEELKTLKSTQEKLRRQIMLQEMLRQRLEGKRFFIVLDDVLEDTHWQLLKNAFPDEQGRASRLLFTSRQEIFTKRDDGYIHKMRLLNPDESWELLLKTTFMDRREGIRCPKELEDIGRMILEKCHGLPLAITVAGGLLVNQEESERGWEKVLKQVNAYGSKSNEIEKNASSILELSYHNLPLHLKPCFLSLAFFKVDEVIQAKRLVHIWVALGLVKVHEETVEEISMRYLDELINRNLVQVKEMTIDDRVRYCKVHDLLHELSIKKAKEEIGFESLIIEEEGSSSLSSSSSKPRHRVVRGSGKRVIQIDTSNKNKDKNKHVRSLFLHVENCPCLTTPSYWKGFELLRILDMEGSIFWSFPSTIRAFIGIRYLRLKEKKSVLLIPRWLDELKNLEVLDIAECMRVTFPDVTWRMHSLRHFYSNYRILEFSNSMKKSSWPNLETWKYISLDAAVFLIQRSGCRLRELGINVMGSNRNVEEKKLLGRLLVESEIQVLHLQWDRETLETLPISNSMVHLTKLEVTGRIALCLNADNFPQNITHLKILGCDITRQDMQVLCMLPKLLFLTLHDVRFSIEKSIKVSREGFPRLKVLHLRKMLIENIEIEEGGMPQLQRLEIYRCSTPENIDNLRERIRHAEIIIVEA